MQGEVNEPRGLAGWARRRFSIARARFCGTSSTPRNPVGYGMPAAWPVFFEHDQAYRLRPGFSSRAEVVARYPKSGPVLERLLGENYLRDQANVVAFEVGKGKVVALGSQVDFRTQPRGLSRLRNTVSTLVPARWTRREAPLRRLVAVRLVLLL